MAWNCDRQCGDSALGQYATPGWIADLLVGRLDSAARVFDLGLGLGSLSFAARKRFPGATILGVDVESHSRRLCHSLLQRGIQPLRGDIMDPSYWRRLVRQFGRADLVVSNPPYGYCGKSITEPTVRRLLGEEMPPWIVRRSEIAFLAAGMEIVKQGGTLAYVLPYSLMEYHRGALLRVFARNGLAEIIELDAGVFRGTEAKTAVFVYRKGEVRNMVDIYQASRSGHLRVRQPIDVGEAGIMKSSALPTLATMGVSVRRGKCSQAELQRDRVPYFHTTSFAAYARKVVDLGRPRTATDQVVASVGDILLPRVGSRCLDYEALVRSGRRAITDCVLRIRAPEDIRRPLWRFLISDKGRAWRKNLIRGSCARFLAQEHLHTAPIPL